MNRLKALVIMVSTIREQARSEKAYLGNFWAELSSTTMYTVTALVFTNLLFRRAGLIAGYSRDEFYFMYIIGQVGYYLIVGVIHTPIALLVENVRNGYFDLMLLRPVPIRMNVYARGIRPLSLLFTSLPTILMILVVNWHHIYVSLSSVFFGMLVWVSGVIIFNTLIFALALPVFTQGDATDMLNAWYGTMAITEIPYGKLPNVIRWLSLGVLPAILMTGGAAAVMLGKIPVRPVLLSAVLAACAALLLYQWMWKWALRNYASASS